jgi:hypothetical protein
MMAFRAHFVFAYGHHAAMAAPPRLGGQVGGKFPPEMT